MTEQKGRLASAAGERTASRHIKADRYLSGINKRLFEGSTPETEIKGLMTIADGNINYIGRSVLKYIKAESARQSRQTEAFRLPQGILERYIMFDGEPLGKLSKEALTRYIEEMKQHELFMKMMFKANGFNEMDELPT